MPKRTDIKRILVIGSGPIVIGQACEFDYSGAQACKVLKEDGYEVVLVNSNPATIMTDPGLADRTYVEPITAEFIERVIERERPDALLLLILFHPAPQRLYGYLVCLRHLLERPAALQTGHRRSDGAERRGRFGEERRARALRRRDDRLRPGGYRTR